MRNALPLILCAAIAASAQSVERAETSQQTRDGGNAAAVARAAVSGSSTETPDISGTVWGKYRLASSLETGYRFVDARGNRDRYLSDVNVRRGLRLFDYSLDASAEPGKGAWFDFLRSDILNAGGDAGQSFSIRADKARYYKLDASVRRFNYFRALPGFALEQHDYDLRQQMSDYSLKVFPQRAVRLNLAYSRSVAKGPFETTYDYERDEFPVAGRARWEANEYRVGFDATVRGWDLVFEEMFRRFRNDVVHTQTTLNNPGNQTANTSVLTAFDRNSPERAASAGSRVSVRGDIGPRAHLVLRAMYGRETLDLRQVESTTGTDANNRRVLSRQFAAVSRVQRPNGSGEAMLTIDVADWLSVSETARYSAYRIDGQTAIDDRSVRQTPTGAPLDVNSASLASRYTDHTSFYNTLEAHAGLGSKLDVNGGWRATRRRVVLRSPESPAERETQSTHAAVAGLRYRPTGRFNVFGAIEHGTADNALVRINPLDFQRIRMRARLELPGSVSVHGVWTSMDRRNPTRFVENDSNARSISGNALWDPDPRVSVSAGYGYDHFASTAGIVFFVAGRLNTGRSIFYARQNFVHVDARIAATRRLDVFAAYRYNQDRGAPQTALVAQVNDFVAALPMRRHNPEARLSWRFNNHFTGSVSYRHFSLNERGLTVPNYRTNILTLSTRWTL